MHHIKINPEVAVVLGTSRAKKNGRASLFAKVFFRGIKKEQPFHMSETNSLEPLKMNNDRTNRWCGIYTNKPPLATKRVPIPTPKIFSNHPHLFSKTIVYSLSLTHQPINLLSKQIIKMYLPLAPTR